MDFQGTEIYEDGDDPICRTYPDFQTIIDDSDEIWLTQKP
jgi:hypothetical protein